ncbi:MFS transporter [Actinosynnema sp. NPDC023794]
MDVPGGLRERRALSAAALVGGPVELIDVVLPLWAGAAIGLSAAEVGVLVAVVAGVSLVARPVARVLVDRRERRHTAAVGAALYALACAGYAVAQSAPLAYGAAAVGGAGGTLLWVAVRAVVRERQADDTEAFLRVASARDAGSLVTTALGLGFFGIVGFAGVFWASAAMCVVAAAFLVAAPRRPDSAGEGPVESGGDGREDGAAVGRRRLAPVAEAMVTAAEAAVALLLVLHLQRGFDLGVVQVVLVFVPGSMVAGIAFLHLRQRTSRYGRKRVFAVASLVSCAATLGFALAPDPYVIAALWMLNGAAWGAVLSVRRAVADAAVRPALGMHDAAGLVGLVIGSLAAGFLYDGVPWWAACVVAAVAILAGAGTLWSAARRLGVPDVPVVKT